MSLIGLVHLAEGVLKQQGQESQNNTTPAGKTQAQPARQQTNTIDRDEFRRSNESAGNEAGLFQVKQQSVFTTAVTVLLVQGGAEQTAPNTRTAQTSANPQSAATNAETSAAAANATNTTTANNTQVLSQLSSLNAALVALGLSQDEIDVVDRVAQLIKNFGPAAFTSLVNQLQMLAQNNGQSAANTATNATTNAAANAGTAAANPTANNAATGAQNGTTPATQNAGFTIASVNIKFAGIDETLQRNGKNSNAGTLQVSPFQLQVSEVKLTLNSAATGQSAQIEAPQAQATTPLTKATTA